MNASTISPVSIDFERTDAYRRLDMTFYNPERLTAVARLERGQGEVVTLERVLAEPPATGRTLPTADYVRKGDGIPIAKVANLSPTFAVDWERRTLVPSGYFDRSTKGELLPHDIVLLCAAHHTGYIGINTSIVADMPGEQASFVGELIRLRVDEDAIDPYYLTVLLNHDSVRAQLRNTVRGVTIHLYPQDIRTLALLRPERPIQKRIGDLMRASCAARAEARRLEEQVTAIFSRYLPLDEVDYAVSFDYTPQECAQHARLDANFFDARYRPFLDVPTIGIARTLSAVVTRSIARGSQPEYDDAHGLVPVLKTTNVQNRRIDWARCRRVAESFYDANPRAHLRRDDVVITSTGEGSWGRAAIVDADRAFADGHLTILRVDPDVVDPYTLTAFLWSRYGRLQFEQRVRGSTGQTEIYPRDIEQILAVIPAADDQRSIRGMMLDQFAALARADGLKEQAVRDVDALIGDVA